MFLEARDRGDERSEGVGLALAEWMPLLLPPEPFSFWNLSITWKEMMTCWIVKFF